MSPYAYPPSHSHVAQAVARRIRHATPSGLLETHPGLVETVLCGLLLKQGCRNPTTIQQIVGESLEDIQPHIDRILDNPESSVWYFSMLDSLDRQIPQSSLPAATTTGAIGKSTTSAWSSSSRKFPTAATVGALPPLPVCNGSLASYRSEAMKPMPALG